ncbi:hypothetical protein ABB37_00660 [Leptomonas pyrrhocoris]|uniref:Uncharacterized protein n=1 Tax=Leptomonas pyrrhocoris TaxID=157538 RepID=A0A0N0VI01_LEPPY|nr:hypothetical protein ABB37_00660 [Leptomonas pyrrhocoris]KPA86514.1 hypothetical protein ABB37_00660 [Leptomonas pyrrhocoris]|eukprot:XP_015664953.1 hypothetical protein ABB37_00660 [Leptomonas pyrrhocoris]
MTSAFPEWQGEEIVEDVPEFLDGKKRELPAAMVRHRGRVPPKKSARNSASPKVTVDIHTFECQAIDDDLATESLGGPSPLNLEIDLSKPAHKAPNNTTITAAVSSARVMRDAAPERGPALKAASNGTNDCSDSSTQASSSNSSNRQRPPPTRTLGQLRTNPRHVTLPSATMSKSINGTPNRLSPSMNDVDEPPRALAATVVPTEAAATLPPPPSPTTATTTTTSATIKPAQTPVTHAWRHVNNKKSSSPSLDSDCESTSGINSPTDSSPSKSALPFSAPAGQHIPTSLRDVVPVAAATSAPGHRQSVLSPRKSYSTEVAAPLAVKQDLPALATARQLDAARRVAPVKPSLLAAAGSGAATATALAPQPASRSRTVSQAEGTTASVPSTGSSATKTRVNATASSGRATAVSRELSRCSTRPRPVNEPAKQIDLPTLPLMSTNTHKSNNTNYSGKDKVNNGAGDGHVGGEASHKDVEVPVSEQEPSTARRSTHTVNSSLMSSTGYSVLRGAFDSHATFDFGATLPSVAGLNASQGPTVSGGRVASARPPNMMVVNDATALRARTSFVRAGSIHRKPQTNGTSGRDGPVPSTSANVAGRRSSTPASRAARCASHDRSPSAKTPEGAEDDSEVHDKHRKRAPQTKRELRRRNTEFEKV